jgi:hypothetical protein
MAIGITTRTVGGTKRAGGTATTSTTTMSMTEMREMAMATDMPMDMIRNTVTATTIDRKIYN